MSNRPNCRIYGFGTKDQLISAIKVVMDFRYGFYYSPKENKIRVQTRSTRFARELEIEFRELGMKTERHYDR